MVPRKSTMNRWCWVSCAIWVALGVSVLTPVRAQQPVQVINRNYEIETKFVYYLAAFVKPIQPADMAQRFALIQPRLDAFRSRNNRWPTKEQFDTEILPALLEQDGTKLP